MAGTVKGATKLKLGKKIGILVLTLFIGIVVLQNTERVSDENSFSDDLHTQGASAFSIGFIRIYHRCAGLLANGK